MFLVILKIYEFEESCSSSEIIGSPSNTGYTTAIHKVELDSIDNAFSPSEAAVNSKDKETKSSPSSLNNQPKFGESVSLL